MKSKRRSTKSNVEDANGIRISYHEKVCAERMKTLFKAIDEMKSDIKSLKEDMNRGKGAAAIIILIGGLIGSIFYFFCRNRKTRAVGLSNELLAAAEFAKDPDLIVFVPVGGTGPIDILTLNTKTKEINTYDVKTQNFRSNGWKISRGRTAEQKRLGVKILNFDPKNI